MTATPSTEQAAAAAAAAAKGSAMSSVVYEPFLWWAERRGMADRRRDLVARATGSVLEIGAGTGLNADHYPPDLDRLVLTEPEVHMARRLEQRVQRLGLRAEVVRAPAHLLPWEDGTFDTVVSTLVLCTVPDQGAALAEIRRVLRPGGALLFLEHVRADTARLAGWQDRLRGPWAAFADGCQCNRDTVAAIEQAGFSVAARRTATWRGMPRVVHPLVVGRAVEEAPTLRRFPERAREDSNL